MIPTLHLGGLGFSGGAGGGSPTDPYFASVLSLLHMDGADGSTTFTDVTGKTWTAAGTAQIDTAQSKYGGASGLFDTTGDYVDATDASFALGTGDFTVEFWLRNSGSGAKVIYDHRPASTEGLYPTIYHIGSTLKFYTNSADRISGNVLAASTWNHVALCRASGTTRLFYGGTQVGSNYTDSNNYIGTRIRLGASGYDGANGIDGHIDDFRLTTVARYTSNFTPPSSAYPDS